MTTDFFKRPMYYGADSETFRAAGMLRKNMTLAESILWKRLKNKNIFPVKFRRQHPVKFFIVDFYCHEIKLAIEVDGELHFNEENKEYDLNRTAELNKYGITVIRFQNDEVINNTTEVQSRIIKTIEELTHFNLDEK